MKKIFLLFIMCLFLCSFTNVSFDPQTNIIQTTEKISVEKNQVYYFTYCKLYEDSNYFELLEKEGINNKSLVVRTDTLNEKIEFKKEVMPYGSVYYAKIITGNDSFIYYLSAPATKEMSLNKDSYFRLVKEDEFENLNIYYEKTIKPTNNISYDGIYYVNVDNIEKINDIIKNVKATDNNDGVLDNLEVIYDEYSNKSSIGDYLVKIKAKDLANNESIYNLLIKIVDVSKPTINLVNHSKRIEVSNKEKLDYNYLLSLVKVSDNVSDMTNRVRISFNNYFRNEQTNGEYKITYYAMDESNNISTLDLAIGVGKTNPEYEIKKLKDDNLSVNDAVLMYFDYLGIKPKYEITLDEYTGYEYIEGNYLVGISYESDGLKYTLINIKVENEEKIIEVNEEKSFNKLILLAIIPVIGLIILAIFIVKKRIKNKKW